MSILLPFFRHHRLLTVNSIIVINIQFEACTIFSYLLDLLTEGKFGIVYLLDTIKANI